MRRNRQCESEEETGIDMTPMLDVVFIMLIFFIVTTSFVKTSGITVDRPSAATADKKDRVSIIVAVAPNGEVWVDGRSVPLAGVRTTVARLKAEHPRGTVVVDADAGARTGRLVEVLDRVRAAGVQDIALAADEQ